VEVTPSRNVCNLCEDVPNTLNKEICLTKDNLIRLCSLAIMKRGTPVWKTKGSSQVKVGVKVKVKVTLRPTISRPVRLDIKRPSGTRDQVFLSL
jgi:hypothetical protein